MGQNRERQRVCVCVCVCMREREGERERELENKMKITWQNIEGSLGIDQCYGLGENRDRWNSPRHPFHLLHLILPKSVSCISDNFSFSGVLLK